MSDPRRLLAPDALGSLRGRVFSYIGGNVSRAHCESLAPYVAGFTLAGKRGRKMARSIAATTGAPVLWDPALYVAQVGATCRTPTLFDEDENVGFQADLGVAAFLSASGWVPDRDGEALRRVVDEGRRFCDRADRSGHSAPSFVVVPIGSWWLTRGRERLITELRRVERPIALVLCSRNDPLGVVGGVAGLVAVVRSVPDVAVIRTDLAGLGAMAHGSPFSAIGTGTGARHSVPVGTTGGGAPDDDTPSVLVRGAGVYKKGSQIERCRSDGGLLSCPLPPCKGRHLRRFADPASRPEAMLHAFAVIQELADGILSHDPALRPEAWRLFAERAVQRLDDLETRTRVPWEAPRALTDWASTPGSPRID
ncbi:MAG TPA: hypothetical protein VGB14_17735 [Acidimicrobiales bacterium]